MDFDKTFEVSVASPMRKPTERRNRKRRKLRVGNKGGQMDGQATIIRDIYAAAMDEHPWQEVVGNVADLLGATGAFMFTTYVPESAGGLAVCHGLPKHETQQFLTEVATVDVWYQALLRRHGHLRTGLQWQTHGLLSERALRRTRFFSDYLVPCDIGHNLGAIVGDGSSDGPPLLPLCFYRPVGAQPFSAQQEATLGALQPHFTRAMTIRGRLQETAQGFAELAVQRVSTALVVLARNRKILFANSAADELLSGTDRPLVRDGRLCTNDSAELVALERALEACARYSFDGRFSLSARLCGAPGDGIVARLVPSPMSAPSASKAAAIAFLVREGRTVIDVSATMTSLYRLSVAESALVKALCDGKTQEAFAEARRVSLATVKTQLRSVFAKTGTRRQSDLMRLVYSVAH